MIIIDWFNRSIKIDTHSPNGLNCYWLLTRLHSFPCFDQSHGIFTKHLFPYFTCSRPMLVFEMAKQVELSIRCVISSNVVFRPRFPSLLAANKKHVSLFWDLLINKCSLKVAVCHLDLRTEESRNYHLISCSCLETIKRFSN